MKIDARRALRIVYRGRPYYFCSPNCRNSFRRRPPRYAVASISPPARPARTRRQT
jgi:YHS domain-containing protein